MLINGKFTSNNNKSNYYILWLWKQCSHQVTCWRRLSNFATVLEETPLTRESNRLLKDLFEGDLTLVLVKSVGRQKHWVKRAAFETGSLS